MQRGAEVVGIEAEGEGEARLGVEVHDEDTTSLLRKGHTERLHGGRLGDAALLIGDREDFDHRVTIGPQP